MGHQLQERQGIGWVAPPADWLRGTLAAVSLRSGGVSNPPFDTLNLGRSAGDEISDVEENERLLASALSLPGGAARARLDHGRDCVAVISPGTYRGCDGLLTRSVELPLWLTVADCYPLFLAGDDCIGLAHCGWRGVRAGIVGALAGAVSVAGGNPASRLRAWIGPGIGPCCYPVRDEVAALFAPDHLRGASGARHLDLRAAIEADLTAAGVSEDGIDACGICTSCEAEMFFSYRRDGARSGRMAAVIWRRDS